MQLNLRGKTALVTGGSRGIGAAICRALAAEGVDIGFSYQTQSEAAEALVAELRGTGVRAVALQADMGDEAAVLEFLTRATQALGPAEILVNNAAICPSGPVESYSWETWERTFRVNVAGAFLASRELARAWKERQVPGRIVNIASQAAFLGSTSGHLPYDSSKGALVSMTRALARELGPFGIRVNAVAPGLVKTEMVGKNLETKLESYLARIPLKRIADPEEIASIAVFLASDAASCMTGATVDATGGMIMH